MKKIIVSRVVFIGLILLVLWLGNNSFAYNQLNEQSYQGQRESQSSTILLNKQTMSLRIMQGIASEQDTVLEFMVWPKERQKVLAESIDLAQQQINLEPAQSYHWQRLLALQYEYQPEPEALTWMLDKIYVLTGWNRNTIINLSRYCVPFAFDNQFQLTPEASNKTKNDSLGVCNEIIDDLPLKENKPRLASQIGISTEDLQVVLSRFKGTNE